MIFSVLKMLIFKIDSIRNSWLVFNQVLRLNRKPFDRVLHNNQKKYLKSRLVKNCIKLLFVLLFEYKHLIFKQ